MADDDGQGDGTGTPDPPPTTDWEAEAKRLEADLAKEQRYKRKVEDQHKATLKRLEGLEQASLSDTEKAVAQARQAAADEARQATVAEFGHRLVDAKVEAIAGGRGVDVQTLLEGLDRSRFLGPDLEPDTAAITRWVDAIAPKRDAAGFDIGQGARGNGAGGTDLADQGAFAKMLLDAVGGPRKRT